MPGTSPVRYTNSLIGSVDDPSSQAFTGFGYALDVSGKWALIGSPYLDSTSPSFFSNSGGAYLWNWETGGLFEIPNPTPAAYDEFGTSVAIYGDRFVIGAPTDDTHFTNSGSAYVYTFSSSSFSAPNIQLLGLLAAPPAGTYSGLGRSLDISASTIVAGSIGSVEAYRYDLSGNLLQAVNNLDFGNYRTSVAIDSGLSAAGGETVVWGLSGIGQSSRWAGVYGTELSNLSFAVNTNLDIPDSLSGNGIALASNGGGNLTTLRSAVEEANLLWGRAASITFAPGIGYLSLSQVGSEVKGVQNNDLDVTGRVTITGAGAGYSIIDGGGDGNGAGVGSFEDRIFEVKPGGSLTLSKLTISGGRATTTGNDAGAGILVRSSQNNAHSSYDPVAAAVAKLTLDEVAVTGNYAKQVASGIWSLGGDVTITNSVIAGNRLQGNPFDRADTAGFRFSGYAAGREAVTRIGGTVIADNISDEESYWYHDVSDGGFGTVIDLGLNRFESAGTPIENNKNGNYIAGVNLPNESVQVVTSAVDTFSSGDDHRNLSLREAIHNANMQDAVERQVWLPSWRIVLSLPRAANDFNGTAAGDVDVFGQVFLRGGGAGVSIIDAQMIESLGTNAINDRVFSVHSQAVLKLQDLTVAGGNATATYDDFAGALLVAANSRAEVSRTAITNNRAKDHAGAIWNAGGVLMLEDSVVAQNSVANVSNFAWASGGVHSNTMSSGQLSLSGSMLANNMNLAPMPNTEVGHDLEVASSGGMTFLDAGFNRIESEDSPLVQGVNHNYIGNADLVVTSIADTQIDHSNDSRSITLRESVDLANSTSGTQEVWLPAFRFVVMRNKLTAPGGDSTMVADGDLDVLGGSLTLRGVPARTTIGSFSASVADRVFELIGDYERNATSVAGGYGYSVNNSDLAVTSPAADGDDDGDLDANDLALCNSNSGNVFILVDVSRAVTNNITSVLVDSLSI